MRNIPTLAAGTSAHTTLVFRFFFLLRRRFLWSFLFTSFPCISCGGRRKLSFFCHLSRFLWFFVLFSRSMCLLRPALKRSRLERSTKSLPLANRRCFLFDAQSQCPSGGLCKKECWVALAWLLSCRFSSRFISSLWVRVCAFLSCYFPMCLRWGSFRRPTLQEDAERCLLGSRTKLNIVYVYLLHVRGH